MNVSCSAKVNACPLLLSAACVFYEGENLIYIGVNMNDSLQTALEKLNIAFSDNTLSISVISPLQVTPGQNPVISILQSSASSNGYLSSTDWTTFNSKQNQLNGTGFVKANGTIITYDNSTYYLASNPSAFIPLTAISSTATGLTYTNTTGVFSLTAGYLIPTIASYNNVNWDTAYTNRITSLTNTGSSGAATLLSNVLNVPNYTLSGLGGVPSTRTLTINGTTFDLSANRTWTIPSDNIYNSDGTLTGSRIVTSGGFPLTFTGSNTAASLIARGLNLTHTLVASANNDVLVGLDVNPTFTNGAFTGVTNTALRVGGDIQITNGIFNFNSNGGVSKIKAYGSDILSVITNANGLFNFGSSPTANLNLAKISINNANNTYSALNIITPTSQIGNGAMIVWMNGTSFAGKIYHSDAVLYDMGFQNINGNYLHMFANGNVLLTNGTRTDAGFKLDVNGTARLGSIKTGNFGSGDSIQFLNQDYSFSTVSNVLKINVGSGVNNKIDITNQGGNTAFRYFTGGVYSTFGMYQTDLFSNNQVGTAILELRSNAMGFLQPRMTTTQRDAIASPATGLSIYNTTTNRVSFYNGTSWVENGDNIYNADGTLTSARTLTHGGFSLSLVGSTHTNRFTSAGRLLLGTTTESTFLLDVVGTARVSGNLYVNNFWTSFLGNTSSSANNPIGQSGISIGWNRSAGQGESIIAYGLNNGGISPRLDISSWDGTTLTTRFSLSNTGVANFTNILTGIITSSTTYTNLNGVNIQTSNGGANGITFQGVATANWYVGRATGFSDNLTFYNNITGNVVNIISATGNFLIGTNTDGGFKLDVNGTARVSGEANIQGLTAGTGNNSPLTNANTAFGYQAGFSNTSGAGVYANSFFGHSAGRLVSTGYGNNFFGYIAGATITTGTYNLAIGMAAMYSAPANVNNNVGLGYSALGQTTGSENVAIGSDSGRAAGSSNVYIGFQSGYLTATGSNNIAIGRVSGQYTGDNKLYIAGSPNAYGNLIYGDFSTGQLKINDTNTPSLTASAQFEVVSTTRGFLPPRMTSTQRDAIATPAAGLQVYNTTGNTLDFYNGTSWSTVSSGNIYTVDGTLTGNRVVSSGGFNLTYSNDALGQYSSAPAGIRLVNNTVSTGGINQYSPPIIMSGNGWNYSNSTPVSIRQYLKVITTPTPLWTLESSINNGSYTPILRASTNGTVSRLMIGLTSEIADTEAAGGKTCLLVAGDIRTFGGYQYSIGLITSASGSSLQSYTNGGISPTQSISFGYFNTTFSTQDITFSGGTTSSKYFGYTTGNWTIGGSADVGYKLDVNGTARFNNSVIAQTVSGTDVLDIGSVRIANSSGGRYIEGFGGMSMRSSTDTGNTLTVGINSTNRWQATTPSIILSPNGIGPQGGFILSSVLTNPSSSTLTFGNNRNDGLKSAIIRTADFSAITASTPIDLYIFAGKETVSTTQGNLFLAHDGTDQRGNVIIGSATNGAYKLDVTGNSRVSGIFRQQTNAGNNFIELDANANATNPFVRLFRSGAFDGHIRMQNAVNVGSVNLTQGFDLYNASTSAYASLAAWNIAAAGGQLGVSNSVGGSSVVHIGYIAGGSGFLQFTQVGAIVRGLIGYDGGSGTMQIRVNNSTSLTTGTLSTAFFSTGNVGINTLTDAGFRLDVNGTARVSGTLTMRDVLDPLGSESVIIRGVHPTGYNGAIVIAQNISKTSGYGLGNVIMNTRSTFTNLTGTYNTLIGAAAGNALTTGGSNVMIGNLAGLNVTTNSYSTYIGSLSTGIAANVYATIQITAGLQPYSEGVVADMYPTNQNFAFIGGGNYANEQIQHFYFGAAPFLREPFYPDANKNINFYAPSASQVTDKSGGNFIINAGRGTGTGTSGDVIFATATPTSTGTTLQTLTNRVWIKGQTGNVGIGASPNAAYKLDVTGAFRATAVESRFEDATYGTIWKFTATKAFFASTTDPGPNGMTVGGLINTDGSFIGTGNITVGGTCIVGSKSFNYNQTILSKTSLFISNYNNSDRFYYDIYYTNNISNTLSKAFNIRIFGGQSSVDYGDVILCYNGTQAVGNTLIGTQTSVASAILNVSSTTQGFLPPRLTTTQKNAIVTPAAGLIVYDSTTNVQIITMVQLG